jgi:hypothetical protein
MLSKLHVDLKTNIEIKVDLQVLTDKLAVDPDARHRRLTRLFQKGRLNFGSLRIQRVQLDSLKGNAVALEEVLDFGAIGAVRLREDCDGVLADHRFNDLGGALLLPIFVADGCHPERGRGVNETECRLEQRRLLQQLT